MTIKLAILDKDGTLVKPKSGNKFVQDPLDQELLSGVEEAIKRLDAEGYVIAVASNQGGVEAGHKTLEDAIQEMQCCMDLIPEISYSLFCPYLAFGLNCWQVKPNGAKKLWQDECLIQKPNHGACGTPIPRSMGCRKPNGGMLLIAMTIASTFDAVMIGDRPEDKGAAESASIPFWDAADWRNGITP